MDITYDRSRDNGITPAETLKSVFRNYIQGECDAEYTSSDKSTVFGVCGLPYGMPVSSILMNNPEFNEYSGSNTLIVYGEKIEAYSERGKIKLSKDAASAVKNAVASCVCGVGTIDADGAHVTDLLGENVGSHYNVNLLLGNRIGYPSPLISTPKSAVDSLGRGSFRADAGRQVLATRYDFRFEDNGEPTNRQFYLYENGKQIFYSANVKENVKRGVCRHMPNRTVIEYETNCGLKITRTIFIMPQDENMPEAVEAQRVEIENTSNKKRNIKAVFTGNFGISSIESLSNDLVYASVIHEGGVIREDGKATAVAPSSHPGYMRWQKRFAEIFESGEPMDEFCTTYNDFFGNGTIERPEFGAHLASKLASKCVSFFAMAKSVVIESGGKKTFDSFVGFTGDKTPDLSVFKKKLSNFTSKYRNAENTAVAYKKVCDFVEEYSSYVKLSSENALFDSYVNNNLPFQVLYQSFVSRSFAWAQKAYREIGFREIQDIYASLYYMCAMGNSALAKELISRWARNVYKMGYANHNFYETGKEPGMCSDDGLWLVQAVYRYVSLTGDYGFLDEEFDMADGGTRKLIDTMDAVVTYSGKISVGEHGFPLMDKADWNDTMKLDNDWINGEKKQELYFAQLEKTGEKYGAKFESDYSESVMNAFLLKIALDELAEMSDKSGKQNSYKADSDDLCDRLRKFAWKGNFYARAMIGKGHGDFTYLGAHGDGLSADENIDGTYFLNSFSWSMLAGVASEEQIRIMLESVKKYLWTDAGLKLCTPAALEKLANGTAADSYFLGDRENGGVFKHAAMMAVVAMLKASKTVKDVPLAKELSSLAFDMADRTLPYKTLENPYVLKGNPRFCTQYNNSFSGEHSGPMLSGTASWLTLAVFEILGIDYSASGLTISPMLMSGMTNANYKLRFENTELSVSISKPKGFFRADENTKYELDGKPVKNLENLAFTGGNHEIKVTFSGVI